MWRQRYNTINPKNEVLRIVLLIKYPPHGKKGCECGQKSERHRAQREHRETCLGLSCSPVCLCFPPRCSSCSWLITPASSTGEAACSAALAGTWAGNTCRLESRRVCSRFLRDNMWLQRRIREQFCTQSRGKLVELNEMGHFQSERGFHSAASFLLNFHFPSHYRGSFKESLCCWATNVFLANHKIFTSCFNFLP